MIRFRHITPALLNAWLVDQRLVSTHARYRLRVWRENRAALAAIRDEMVVYLNEAFEDARMRIRSGIEDDLSPFSDPAHDPAANCPALLHRVTLQGYLGEQIQGTSERPVGVGPAADVQTGFKRDTAVKGRYYLYVSYY
jgi:hypothetical protein